MNRQNVKGNDMQVLLAEPRGHCAGVVRACAIVRQAREVRWGPPRVRHEIARHRLPTRPRRASHSAWA